MGLFDKLKNNVVSFMASTSLGKSYAIKPKLEEYITDARNEINDLATNIEEIESLKNTPLKKDLKLLIKKSKEILKQVSKDKYLDPLVNIIGDHIGDFESIDDLKEQLPEMKSVKAMKKFGKKLINTENYKELNELLKNLQNFDSLKASTRLRVFEKLNHSQLVEQIEAENKKLKIDTIKVETEKLITDLCNELNLSNKERKKIVSLFNKVTDQHLSELNKIRKHLVIHLPEFLEKEKMRIRKSYPELEIESEAPKKKKGTVTPAFAKEVKAANEAYANKTQTNKPAPKKKAEITPLFSEEVAKNKPKRESATNKVKPKSVKHEKPVENKKEIKKEPKKERKKESKIKIM